MKNVLVADIMTREPVTIKSDATLLECAKKMVRKKVGSLLITSGKSKTKLVGFISQQDILWALVKSSKKDLSTIKAIDISPKKIAKINPSRTIKEAISKMKKLRFERLPVIHQGELIGVVTVKDILNFHPEFYPEIDEFAKIKEESKKLKRVKKVKKSFYEGICEECGNEDNLQRFNGMLICESCKNSM